MHTDRTPIAVLATSLVCLLGGRPWGQELALDYLYRYDCQAGIPDHLMHSVEVSGNRAIVASNRGLTLVDLGALPVGGTQSYLFRLAGPNARDMVVKALREMGLAVDMPKATFYLWCQVPARGTGRAPMSKSFCQTLLEQTGVCVTPGTGFGRGGEGRFRISLTASEVRLQEAVARLGQFLSSN